ncbi:phospholipid phosphatase 4-like [Branchiostoma lanceolatum]|uniref:phospholipid phosphatase 4-like n=1 Tax=Branchiostoma lanceolatum TaxID=7740 RepID=UPI003451C954
MDFVSACHRCTMARQAAYIVSELVVRILLLVIFLITEDMVPFIREIQPEERWLYKYPHIQHDAVPSTVMFAIAISAPLIVVIVYSTVKRDKIEAFQGILAVTLALVLNGVVTNTVKLMYGRPRPDFFSRCFPDGKWSKDMKCTGDPDTIIEGRKSFPSGHSSFSFTGLTFAALYLAGKLHCFQGKGRGQSWRLLLAGLPLLGATMIAVSRTSDYRHHWQDIAVGSAMGLLMAYTIYRQYYPALSKPCCDMPHVAITPLADSALSNYDVDQDTLIQVKTSDSAIKMI